MSLAFWFFACWYKFRKTKSWFNDFWVGLVKDGRGPLVQSAASRCILVLFEQYWCQKNAPKKLSPYIFHVKTKWNTVYKYLKTKIFSRDTKNHPQMPQQLYFLLILNIAYGSSRSEISSVLMALQCINLVKTLELMCSITVLPFLVGSVTCCCKEKLCKIFLYLLVNSFWWLSKLMLKSPITIRTPF